MHIVLGDGELTSKELTETLSDLWKADEAKDQAFWFVLLGKSSPTKTDRYLVTWLEKNAIYYEVVTDDADAMDEVYSQPQETHIAKKLSAKIVTLLQTKPEEGEDAEVLALFVDVNNATAEEDRWVNGVLQAANDAGFPARALNDGLVEIDFSTQEPVEETPTPAKRSVAKKAAAPRTPVSEEPEAEEALELPAEDVTTYTREQLEEMEPAAVREVAASLGIELPPRTRTTTYIEAILDSGVEEAEEETELEAEVNDEPLLSTNGYADADVIAAKVAEILWSKIVAAVSS